MADDLDFDALLKLDALDEDVSKGLLSFFEDLEADIPQKSHTNIEEEKSDENQEYLVDFSEFLDTLDLGSCLPLENCSNSDAGGIAVSEIFSNYEPTPCETCGAKGKNYRRKLVFISYEEALYMCENEECEDDSDIGPIRVNFWDKPLTAEEIEHHNLPGEILEHIPVITYRDLKKILYIAKYRDSLQRFEWAKEVAERTYDIELKLLENRNAIPLDLGAPPTKADFFLAEVSDDEVKSITDILNSIGKAGESTDRKIVKSKPKKSDHSPVSHELPPAEAPAENLEICGSDKKIDKKKRVRKIVYNPATGKATREGKIKNARKTVNSWKTSFKIFTTKCTE